MTTIIISTLAICFFGTALAAIVECFDNEPEQLELSLSAGDDSRDHRI